MEEIPDIISNLPQEIQQLIVSLIPLKEAIRTSILSTSWRTFWAPFQVNLEFDSDEITSLKASDHLNQIMGSFLKSFCSPQLMKLSLRNPKPPNSSTIEEDELFLMATKGVEKEVHLDFSVENQVNKDFNLILKSSCLRKERTNYFSLKTLHLISVTNLSEIFVSALFYNCHFLESLKLEKCSRLQNINLKANNFLEKLIVMDCKDLVSITLSAPKLKYFWYQGVFPTIQLENTPHLVDVILNFKDGLGHNEFDCEDVLSLLASLKDIEMLTLSGWLLEWLCTEGVIFGKLEFKFNKLKEFCWIDSLMNRQKRDSLACFLNMAIFLEKLFVNIDQQYCSPFSRPFFNQYWHEPHLWMDYTTVKSNASQLNHLKTVNLVGFTKEEDQLLLMDLLISKAIALKKVTVTSPGNHSWWVAKIPQSQINKMSNCCSKYMVVSSSTIECSFVLTEEDNNGFCPEKYHCLY